MRINQGIVIMSVGIAGMIFSELMNFSTSIQLVFTFIVGSGVARLNEYWGSN